MNILDCVVTKVLSEPYFKYMWCVDVEADSWGSVQKTTVTLNSKAEAEQVKEGYKFTA